MSNHCGQPHLTIQQIAEDYAKWASEWRAANLPEGTWPNNAPGFEAYLAAKIDKENQ